MIFHATDDLLLIAACMSVPVETQLRQRLKGSWLSVVLLENYPDAIIYTIGCPWCNCAIEKGWNS